MFILIYGRSNCSYCTRAIELAKILKNKIHDCNFNYINIEKHGFSLEDLSKKIKKNIKTIPQIFINDNYIGGYEDFSIYVKKNKLI